MEVSVVLHLLDHCIETEARRAMKMREAILLDDEDIEARQPQVVEELEMLTEFLQTRDFRRLRAADSDLAGGRDVRVRIFRNAAGAVEFAKIDG